MEHKHSVVDSDTRFSIDPITRRIKNESNKKVVLVQNDHNSEIFTFECPRIIEGHDMSLCNEVEIHFINIESKGGRKQSGFYTVKDFGVDPEDESKVVCSWKIRREATGLVGALTFLVRYKCKEEKVITYDWHTEIYKGITVSDGINADETFEDDYVDVIERWKDSVMAHFTAELTAWKVRTASEVREEAFEDIAVERKRIDYLYNYVTPQMFGAVGDGVTDDTEAIKNALDYTSEHGGIIFIPHGEYLISEMIEISNIETMVSVGCLIYSGDDVAVYANGNEDANLQIRVKNLKNRHIGTGVKLVNLYQCNIELHIVGFNIGCEFLGDGTGFVYNTIKPRYIMSNAVALKLNSANSGWCNQNVFNAGRIGKYSGDAFDLTGILITSEYGYYSNSNVFYGVSIEGKALHAVHIQYGQYNRFDEIRNEGCINTLTEENESMCNTVIVSYGANDDHINNAAYIGSTVVPFRNRHLPKYRQVFNCEEVVKKVYHTANRVTSSMFKLMTYEGVKDIVSSANLDVSGDYIHSKAFPCLALKIDPTVGNQYYITLNCQEEYTGRFAIVAYDKNGEFITNQPIKLRVHENMALVEASGLYYFQTQADGKDSIEFEVIDSNVKELYVFFKGGTNDLYIRGVTVFATGDGRVINDVIPQLNGIPNNAGCFGDMVKSSIDNNTVWVMLDQWKAITL